MPPADQLVQAAHACLEAGRTYPQPEAPCHLVVLAVRSEDGLHAALEAIRPVRAIPFYEPDNGLRWTAACTEPVQGERRRVFRRFPLWKP